MSFLRTISGRLTLLYVVIISAVLCAFGGFSYYQASQNKKEQVDDVLNGISARLLISLPGILWNLDQEQLLKVLSAEAASDMVFAIVVSDDSGKITGGVLRGSDGNLTTPTAMPTRAGHSRKMDLSYFEKGKSSPVGSATVFVSTDRLDATLRQSIFWLIGEVVVLDLIIVVALKLGIAALVIRPLAQIKLALQDIAEGEANLTKRLSESSGDEFGEVAHWFNVFIGRLQSVFQQVAVNSALLAQTAEDTLRVSERASSGAEKQKQMTGEMAAAVHHLNEQVIEVSKNASIGSEASVAADEDAKKSHQVIAESIRSTQELAEHVEAVATVVGRLATDTEKIDGVLNVIVEIAGQTNLLALNAAIEAARAGEQGRGFAVVADEVRKLAERTTNSTHEIQEMVTRIKDGNRQASEAMDASRARSEVGVKYSNQAQTVIDGIVASISRISDLNSQVLTATNAQAQAVEGITGSIDRALQLSEETVEVSHHASQASEKLEQLANDLRSLVAEFKT